MRFIAEIFRWMFGKNVNDGFAFVRIPRNMPQRLHRIPRSIETTLRYTSASFGLHLEQIFPDVKKSMRSISFSEEQLLRASKKGLENKPFSDELSNIIQKVLVKASPDYSYVRDNRRHFLHLIGEILKQVRKLEKRSEWSDVYLMVEILREILDLSYEDAFQKPITPSATLIREKYGDGKKKS